jgi:hypothetical protein
MVSTYREREDPDYTMDVYVWDGDAEALGAAWGAIVFSARGSGAPQEQAVWVGGACVLRVQENGIALARTQADPVGLTPVHVGDALVLVDNHVLIYRAEQLAEHFELVPDPDYILTPSPSALYSAARGSSVYSKSEHSRGVAFDMYKHYLDTF